MDRVLGLRLSIDGDGLVHQDEGAARPTGTTSGLSWPLDPPTPWDALNLAAATWRVCVGARHVRLDVPLRRKVETICCILSAPLSQVVEGIERKEETRMGEAAARVLLTGTPYSQVFIVGDETAWPSKSTWN